MDIKSMFPRASKSFLDANARQSLTDNPPKLSTGILKRSRGIMNKTESEYALILEAQKKRGEIIRYEFEGITLRFQGVKYTPDFVVFSDVNMDPEHDWVYFIEIKGRYISGKFERAIERFRHARTYYPEFQFEMMQKTKDGWKQIL